MTRPQGPPLRVSLPTGGVLAAPRARLGVLVRWPNAGTVRRAVIGTGGPFAIVPQAEWSRLHEGVDLEWLPYAPGFSPPAAVVVGSQFAFRFARFLAPLVLTDGVVEVPRPHVLTQFVTADPPTPLPIILGLWGGVLEGGRIAVDRDPATGSVRGSLEFP